jgi:hypothetical protein
MANGGQAVAGFDVVELFDDAPLAICAEMEGSLVVMKLPHMAIRWRRINKHNNGTRTIELARGKQKQHPGAGIQVICGVSLTHERELEIRPLGWCPGPKIAGDVGAVLRDRYAVLVLVGRAGVCLCHPVAGADKGRLRVDVLGPRLLDRRIKLKVSVVGMAHVCSLLLAGCYVAFVKGRTVVLC